jgi:HD-GYP domain-containing protein (c-di-GMP phosphodiesterase class II)
LNKKSELTFEQYQIIKTHPLIGFLLLKYYSGWEGRQYCDTAFEHHEKIDGSGYPRGIKRIDRYARLIAPVDIYDALISKRPYRQISYNGRLAIDILLEDAKEGKLNKQNVYLLINCLREKKVESLAAMKVSQRRRTAPPAGNLYGRIKKEKARRLLRKD